MSLPRGRKGLELRPGRNLPRKERNGPPELGTLATAQINGPGSTLQFGLLVGIGIRYSGGAKRQSKIVGSEDQSASI